MPVSLRNGLGHGQSYACPSGVGGPGAWEAAEPFGVLAKAKGKRFCQNIQEGVEFYGDREPGILFLDPRP